MKYLFYFIRICLFYFVVLAFYSCELPTEVGAEVFREESFDLFPVDTFSIELSTIKPDSFLTTQSERLLVGYRQDEAFGQLLSIPYFQLGLDTVINDIDRNTNRFDSLTLLIPYDGYYYFDTLREMRLNVHRLTEKMEPEEGFFNRTQFAFNPIPLAQIAFFPRPRRGEPIEIKLPNTLGEELFNLMLDEEEAILREDRFLNFFRGLALVPDTSQNTPFLGLGPDELQMRLYLTNYEFLPSTQYQATFSAATGTLEFFNHLQTDFQASNLDAFQSLKEETITANESANMAHLQGGSDLRIRVEFPYLSNLLVDYEDFIVSNAIFQFKPIDDISTAQEQPLETLITSIIDENNALLRGNTNNARLTYDTEFGRDTYYEVDVTSYVTSQIESGLNEGNALSFAVQFNDAMVDRLRIADFPELEMKLTVFLLRIK